METRLVWYIVAGLGLVAALQLSGWILSSRRAGQEGWPNQYQVKNEISCVKVSDFYSVHLTTYFQSLEDSARELEDSAKEDEESAKKNKAKTFKRYCDKVPGLGHVFFTVDLMEKDARKIPIAFSVFRQGSNGGFELVKDQPAEPHPTGLLSMEMDIAQRGKYLLKLAFGEAKSKDEIIEIPVMVGQ